MAMEAHAMRIPLPTADEQRETQRANAEADAALHDLNAADAQGHRALASSATQSATSVEARAELAKQQAQAAQDRLARLARNEDVAGGLAKPLTIDVAVKAAGFTNGDLKRMRALAAMPEREFETVLLPRLHQSKVRAERSALKQRR
jgi:cytochrome P450